MFGGVLEQDEVQDADVLARSISDWECAELGISDETHELLSANCQEFRQNRILLGAKGSGWGSTPRSRSSPVPGR